MNKDFSEQKEKKDMKIIDFEKKGNTVRFALANRDDDYWGDDWDDSPYEDNAGPVYERFVDGYADFGFGFSVSVLEPSQAYSGSYSKQDMKEKKIPCLIIASKRSLIYSGLPEWEWDDFSSCLNSNIPNVIKIYFGDSIRKVESQLKLLQVAERAQDLKEPGEDFGECFTYIKFSQTRETPEVKDNENN